MSDLIDRQAAIDACMKYNGAGYVWACIMGDIRKLPSAQPEKSTEKHTETHACDLISRQAAIDAVNRAVTQEVARWSLQELPSAQPEQNPDEWCTDCREYDKEKHCCPRFNRIIRTAMGDASRWVSCDEQLPETDEMMLVTAQPKKGAPNVNRAYYMDGAWHGSGSMSNVIAWMPLPDPYEPEEQDANK